MKGLGIRLAVIVFLAVFSFAYVLPWKALGINLSLTDHEYKLGLDLHGWVELDYKIDIEEAKKKNASVNEAEVIEGLKSIIEKRVNSLGTAEPTIQTASYGGENHIVVQIPTQNFAGEKLSEDELRQKNAEYIGKAKETIGRVVRLEFKEQKNEVTEADKTERKAIADKALAEVEAGATPFHVIGNKYKDNNENVEYLSGSAALENLPKEVAFEGIADVKAPFTTKVVTTQKAGTIGIDENQQIMNVEGEKGYTIVRINDVKEEQKEREVTVGTGATATKKKETYTEKTYSYQTIFVNQKTSEWMSAKTADGKILDEQYLTKASVSFSQGLQPQIDLLFNAEGGKIFAELTKRLVGKPIAIFVGGQLLTAPTVQTAISDGKAVITGQYTPEEAKRLANDINTGIVPAPIYLTSERTIDAKIGADSLRVIINAGIIGLLLIILFLTAIYRVSGLLAGIALVIYGLLLLAIVKMFGIVLTLASIAGIILSIGLAIDANILIFERTREALKEKMEKQRSIAVGFQHSWSAIWDSHITSLTSAVILYIFGINLIKGFGLMLGIGIVLSLFTAMWVSRILVTYVGGKMKNMNLFIGMKK